MTPNHPDLRNAMLAAIVDSSDDAIISKDLTGIITSWNKAAERVFGYTSEEAIGKSIMMLLPPGREYEEVEILAKIHAGIRLDHFETLRQTKTGKILNISLTVSPIYFNDEIIGASKIARDITAQKELQTLIVEHAENLEIINNISREIVYELNVENVIQKVINATTKICRAQCGIFVYNMMDEKGISFMIYEKGGHSINKPNTIYNIKTLRKIFADKKTIRIKKINSLENAETTLIEKLFEEENFSVSSCMCIPVISKAGIINGGLFFGHSGEGVFKLEHEKIIESIASQAAIALDNARLYEEIKTLNTRKDEFIGFASHELKTPLTTIKGYVQLAIADPASTARFLPTINKQIDRLTAIISDLLDITRIDSGRLELTFSQVSLSSIIMDCIESIHPIAQNHRIMLPTIKEDFPVMVDAQKMGQVLINILTNAIKYSPENTDITIRIVRMDDQVQISISDQGIGMSDEDASKIFNLFYRIDEGSNSVKGLGIGLYLSQQIILGHNGKIWVESKPGEGSTFFVEFPIEHKI